MDTTRFKQKTVYPMHNKRRDNSTANPYLSKSGEFACQWLGNVDMHVYAKCDKNISRGSRVMNNSTSERTGGRGRAEGL